MHPLDRTLVVCLLLGFGAFVTATPALAAAAAGLLTLAVAFSWLPTASSHEGARELSAHRIVEGGEIQTTARGSARTWVPALFRLRDRPPDIAEAIPPASAGACWGSFELETSHRLELPVPGNAEVGPLTLERFDPLALTRSRLELERGQIVRVWPAGRDARENPLRARYERILSGEHLVQNPGASHEFYGLREYQPGDSQRDINWKATIRQQELMVTQYQHETRGELNVFIDNRVHTRAGTLRSNPTNDVLRSAATLGELAWGQRDILRAYAFGATEPKTFQPQPGASWLDQYLDWLCDLSPEGTRDASVTFDEVLARLTPRSMVVFVTPLLGPGDPLGEAPLRAATLDNSVMVIATRIPEALPASLRDRMREQRQQSVAEVRSAGIELLDLESEPSLVEALTVRSGAQ